VYKYRSNDQKLDFLFLRTSGLWDLGTAGLASWDSLRRLGSEVFCSLVQLCSGIFQCRFLIPKLSIHQLSKSVARSRV